jgi:3-hydroxybutyryl-CoA dehydratase
MSALPAVTRGIDQPRIDAYAAASHDHNPLHVDPAFASRTPFGGTVAHGMLVLALIGEMMYAAHGNGWLERGRLKVRFKAPARPGDVVTASGDMTKEADGIIEYAVQCINQRGEALIEGRAAIGAGP